MNSVVLEKSVKYAIEGVVVAFVVMMLPKVKLSLNETFILAFTAAVVFAVLDMYAPEIAGNARMGTGVGVGFALSGFKF